MGKEYAHIFFDLDRTLWHFDKNSKKVLNDIYIDFELNNFIPHFQEFYKKYYKINEELWDNYRNEKISKEDLRWKRFYNTLIFFKVDNRELSAKIGEYYIINSPKQKELFPFTKEVLKYLSEKYQLHIISNGFEEVQYIKLQESGIINYFKEIILSEKVGVKKPHPLIFKKALKLTGATQNNSIMIGDDLYADIYGAQRVNMDHIYFNYFKKEHNKNVQYEINCLSELYKIL